MLLSDIKLKNTSVKVCTYIQDHDENVQKRLENLGIKVDKTIIMRQRLPFGGPVVVQVGFSIFSLSLEIAQRLRVELCSDEQHKKDLA